MTQCYQSSSFDENKNTFPEFLALLLRILTGLAKF